jgi:hypothetical protein
MGCFWRWVWRSRNRTFGEDEMLRTLVIIGLLAITPFAIGCSSEDGDGGSGGSGATGGSGGTGGTAGAGGGGGDGGSAGSGGSGGVNVLPDGVVCGGTNTPCEIGCSTTSCTQECDGNLNTGGSIMVECTATCPGGGCVQTCEDGATCDMSCDGGGCSQECDAGNCTWSCTGGGCT